MNVYYQPQSIFGMEGSDAVSFELYQGQSNACGIYSQYNILKDFGFKGSVEDLIEEATAKGWYTAEGGTPPEDMGKLLESNGVDCSLYLNGNKYNLIDALAQGKKIIVAVDSGELWDPDNPAEKLEDMFGAENADHALVVVGIDTSDPDNLVVNLADSATGEIAVSYPFEQFQDAWQDSGCRMWITDNPPPETMQLASMANFNYDLGHIETIGEYSYSEWINQFEEYLDFAQLTPNQIDLFFDNSGNWVSDEVLLDIFNNPPMFDNDILFS